ncbi:TauD/TfdA family dioxygenase [Actinoplanes sp. NPDC049802]|uniref:(3R)-3-[(carboxymethyl)amino]fatty acid oxygenase/decarboxylase n=1 Tax=Actinoplanes sp. NPDC049802 TaxID=3154742 RepID=UPI0033FCC4A4
MSMDIIPQEGAEMGVLVEGFVAAEATADDIAALKKTVYEQKILVFKNQNLSPREFLDLGRRFGEPTVYYEPIYHHPEHKEIFVSSNLDTDGKPGVPKTGRFWHSDYMFTPAPYSLTFIYPQVVPKQNRGTYFIDLGKAYQRLPDDLKAAIKDTWCWHSARRHVKIRPSDVYRPIGEVIDEIENATPPTRHPTVFTHPVTGEPTLYLSQAGTYRIDDKDGTELPAELLQRLFEAVGQQDPEFRHENIHLQTFTEGDLLLWDNRSLTHHALHSAKPEPAASFRVTVYDGLPYLGEPA